MKMRNKQNVSLLLCMMLTVVMAFTAIGCNGTQTKDSAVSTESTKQTAETGTQVLGEGQTVFTFIVADKEGNETQFEIHTDKEMVGDALQEAGLIEGEESSYGLFVKTVNGITADYDTDGTYWAFYVNGEYASSGVDTTPVTEGDTYSFKVEK